MKFAVLGSDSFSGAHFARYCRDRGEDVLELGRDFDIDTSLPAIFGVLGFYQPDCVVNFIAKGRVPESWNDPGAWAQTNFSSMTRLYHGLRKLPRIIHISTPEVCGPGECPEGAFQVYRPSSPYAATKAAMEMMLLAMHRHQDFPVIITRGCNIYGPGQTNRIIPNAIAARVSGKTLALSGGGVARRAFIHIDDYCAGIYVVAKRGQDGGIYNIATEPLYSYREVVDMVGATWEESPPRIGEDSVYRMARGKLSLMGWKPTITLEEGIATLWAKK